MNNLLPNPVSERYTGGTCTPTGPVQNGGFAPWCLEAYEQRIGHAACGLHLEKDDTLSPEEYELTTAPDKITVRAATEQGVIWALATLAQMQADGQLPIARIKDAPRYAHRGLLLDCVRHFFPAEEVKRVIEEMARVKLNRLHWVLSNDQGWRIESKAFPQFCQLEGNAFYTQQEIREIVQFAAVRGVEIIPEIDLPGHTTALLAAYPQYSCREEPVQVAKGGGIYGVVLCPGKEKVYAFLEQLLDEVCTLFPGRYFHMGGDEAPDWEWEKCPHCQAKMREQGLIKTRQLQGYFSTRVKEMLRRRGKQVLCWNDTLMADNFAWDADTTVQYWSIQYADATLAGLKNGGRMIYSDMFRFYLDYPSAMTSMKKIYETEPEIRGQVQPVQGMEACLWTENVPDVLTLEDRLFPRLYAFAENCWGTNNAYADFLRRLPPVLDAAHKRGLHTQTLAEADPEGEARKAGIQSYMAAMQSSMSEEMREQAAKFTNPGPEFEARFMQEFFGLPAQPAQKE